MTDKRLMELEKRHKIPEGLLRKIIEIEEDYVYQIKPRGVKKDLEKLIEKFTGRMDEV